MFEKNKKANIIFSIIVLLSLLSLISIIFYNNSIILNNNLFIGNNNSLKENIYKKGDIMANFLKQYNSNGNGVLDAIGCPLDITMSGTTLSGTSISSNLNYNNGFIFCSGEYNLDKFDIYFNKDFSDFSKAYYKDDVVNLINKVGERNFNDIDSTLISFTTSGIFSDNIDDNFNSDNYRGDSQYGINYSNGFQDDDILPRKVILGYIPSNGNKFNIFWNNYKTNKIINQNINNDDLYNLKAGDVENAIIYLELKNDIDNDFDIQIFEFSRQNYINSYTITPINSNAGKSLNYEYGYIQKSSTGVLSISKTITGNEYIFDFKNKDYGIFVTNNTNSDIVYRLSAKTTSGTGIYITPIDDGEIGEIELISNDIIINNNINFMGDNIKIIYKK